LLRGKTEDQNVTRSSVAVARRLLVGLLENGNSQDDRRSGHASTAHPVKPVSVDCRRGSVCCRTGGLREELWINVVKLLRAHGGCLGVRRLRKAWKTAKSSGELSNKR
jgi:hypothetical protein